METRDFRRGVFWRLVLVCIFLQPTNTLQLTATHCNTLPTHLIHSQLVDVAQRRCVLCAPAENKDFAHLLLVQATVSPARVRTRAAPVGLLPVRFIRVVKENLVKKRLASAAENNECVIALFHHGMAPPRRRLDTSRVHKGPCVALDMIFVEVSQVCRPILPAKHKHFRGTLE